MPGPHLAQESIHWLDGVKAAWEQLKSLEPRVRDAGVAVETRLELGPASRVLTDLAARTRAGLLAYSGRRVC